MLSPSGSPGGISLYDDLPLNHIDFANQTCNERIKWKKTLSSGKTDYCWISKEPHDYLDCLAMSRAIAESQGLSAIMASKTAEAPVGCNPYKISMIRRKLALRRKRIKIV